MLLQMDRKAPSSSTTLLLGMVYSNEHAPKRGQEYRDRVRCDALHGLGYDVKTLDNKHSDANLANHCTANFADTRRMIKSMQRKWNDLSFEHVFLDYFMSPVKVTMRRRLM
jgi:gas vesicle protein